VLLGVAYFNVLSHATHWNGSGGAFTTAFALSALLIAGGRLLDEDATSARIRQVMTFFGWSGFVFCSYLLSFEDTGRHLLRWTVNPERASWLIVAYRWPLFLLASAAWGWLLLKKFREQATRVRLEEWLCPIALLYCQGLAAVHYQERSPFVALVFNLICLGIAAMWMVRGCRDGNLRRTVLGSVFLAALVFARYFDLFDSLAVRGVVFLLLGGVLFAEGFYYRRLRLEDADERSSS
jgi:hypothetical protein